MAVPSAPDDTPGVTSSATSTTDSAGPGPAPGSRLLRVLVPVLVLVLLGCLGSLVYLAGSRSAEGASFGDRVASVFEGDTSQAREREVAMSQAKQFVLRLNTYGPQLLDENNAMPEYRELVTEVITPKFATDFEENAALAEQTVAQAGVGRTGEVFATGTSAIDGDSATVLVAGSFTNSYPDPQDPEGRIDTDSLPFRFEVSLKKIDGEWLVDDFVPLTGEAEEPVQ